MLKSIAVAGLLAVSQASVVPTIEIESGVFMPMGGLGTWLYNNSVAEKACDIALKLGYVHIDTAAGYGNQVGVGKAIVKSGRARDSLFITTKIPGGLGYDGSMEALNKNLKELQVDYVDLVLTHYPASWSGTGGKQGRQETWKALEDFKKSGKARSIGISHFCKKHIEDILAINTTAIAVNQVEYHIGMGSASDYATDFRDYVKSLGITYQSFSTLCGPCGTSELVNGEMVTKIGKKYGKSGAQVSLRWAVQQGIPVIPKSGSEAHQISNMDIFSWSLSDEDMATLMSAKGPAAAGGGDAHAGESGDCYID